MRFGVLGPLEVRSADGDPVGVPETKVRALLADLLVHRGRVVSADRLAEDLWAERQPANPLASLQTKVSRLRRALGGLVESRPPGYVLLVEPEAVDLGRFEALLLRARRADNARVRADLLTEALGLWRGPAFADFADEDFVRPAAERAEEQRLTALEWLAEARLELGEQPDLAQLVAEHPLRERLRAAHIRALYRAGRQSEAIEHYEDLRARLAGELGLDPGPELVALHSAILRQDAALAASPVRRSNLPAPVTDIVGRSSAIAEVRELLAAKRLVTLTGTGGVGKTRLAVETAAQLVESFVDGVWLVEFRDDDEVVEEIASVLGIRDDAAPVPLLDRLVDSLRDKHMLLLLDNCEHVVEPVARLVEVLLRTAPSLRVLATSQQPIDIAGETQWTVPTLDIADATKLFAERAAASGYAVDPSMPEVARLCKRLDGIPLALELAATRVRVLGVHELLARLDDRFSVLTSGHRGAPPRQQTLRAMIDWSWDLLTEPERVVLRRLAVHVDGCTLEAAEAVCAADVLAPLARLVDRSLVVVLDGPRYRLLESVAAYSVERLAEAGELDAVRRRHHDYYAGLATSAALRGPDQREWVRRLDRENANLRQALDFGGDIRLAKALSWYWYLSGRISEARRAFEAVREPLDPRSSACLAGMSVLSGQNVEIPETDDPESQWFLGFALYRSGADLSASERLIERALAGATDQWGIAAALSVRASQALVRGDLDRAREDGERAQSLFCELGDQWGQLQTVFPLAALAEISGDYARAERLNRDGLRMAEELHLWSEAADRLTGLGRLALLTGDFAAAEDLHERARKLAARQSYRAGEIHAEIGLALGARRQGDLDTAENHLRGVYEWNRHSAFDPGNALILAELGFVAELRGDADAALALHTKGLAVARRIGDPRAIALAQEGLAGAHSLTGDHEYAARLLAEAAAARNAAGAPLPSAERGDVDRVRARLRSDGVSTAARDPARDR
ncbi:winged helix-turn-helix domain-containing protein [Allokutzneria sp. A3M-2-11 16]|uniref:BTAD domain-containing putative transcriptional regulator n=1 Tax=Allokutzneria sp. A3M-2-11 16 TaxID=2962043 RepID=UPI0020B8C73E|nr:BTAD domain-containing putative transcriptional regulator [Allokutzneria sp. A3M-2-11 16]MCP3802326.1 winged helix-turn-helix domain-containing protein [Allokutzneria sp. A3M-2-11 16]